MSSLLDEGSSPLDNKAGSGHKDDETSDSFFLRLKNNDHNRRRFLFLIGAIIACVILGVVLITIIVVPVYSQSSSPLRGLYVVPDQEISFNPLVPSSYKDEVVALNSFMSKYNNRSKSSGKLVECSDDKPAPHDKFCDFRSSWIYRICPPDLDWNYGSMNPCVLLTLQVPKPIQAYDKYEELPETMPDKLKEHIWVSYNENSEKMPKNIWVSCTNEESYTDPARGFPEYYLPYDDDPDYLPPVVGVMLNLEGKTNNSNEIECKLWAKSINHERDEFATFKFNVSVNSD